MYVNMCYRNACKVLTGKPSGKKLHGKLRRKKDNNIKRERTDIGYHGVASDSTGSGQGQVMRCCEHLGSKTSKVILG
jgi:hypothetical protein